MFRTQSAMSVRITGIGTEIPERVVTTAEVEERAALCERFHVEPGWLERVTGVRERRWADDDVQPSTLAVAAGRKAVARRSRCTGTWVIPSVLLEFELLHGR